jgi:basic amino acid/polyamine antiporter, APA family
MPNIENNNPTLIRGLNLFTSTLLVIGVMMGTGVFKKIIPMAKTGLPEWGILLAIVVAGIMSILGALNISVLAKLTENSGGMYEYLRLCYGNFFSFLFGFTDFTIIGGASIAAVGFVFALSINAIVTVPNPFEAWEHISILGIIKPFKNGGIKLIAIGIIATMSFINMRGVKAAGVVSNIFTATKVMGIMAIIIAAIFYVSPASTANTIIATSTQPTNWFSAFFAAMLAIFWAYDGWIDISFVTGEIKNPKKNVPLAILYGVGFVMLVYLAVHISYMYVVPLPTLAAQPNETIGAAFVAETMLGTAGKNFLSVLIILSVFGTLNAQVLSHSRVYYRMAQEQYFFKQALVVHPKFRTPSNAILFTLCWSSLLVISGSFDMLTDMVVFASFLFYALLAIGVIKLVRKRQLKERVFLFPIIQIVIILFSLALMVNTLITNTSEALIGMLLVAAAVPFYFYFKAKKKD